MPHTTLRPQTRKIALRDCGEITLLPAVDCHHEMAGKVFYHAFRAGFPEALVRERRRQRIERRLLAPHRNEANDGAEDEPIGPRVIVSSLRPAETTASHEAATNLQPVRPFDRDRRLGRRERGERIGERRHAGIKAAARSRERLLRLEYDRKLREVEPSDKNQGSGAEFSGVGGG